MHTLAAAGAGFLIAVLWFDLMFDVQVRRGHGDPVSPEALASVCAYYRRVTIEAAPMPRLIAAVMLVVLGAIDTEIVQGGGWSAWVSLAAASSAIGLAILHTVPGAMRLGRAADPAEDLAGLARAILSDHVYCLAAMTLLLALQLTAALA
jgi:hypothetical protein